MLLEANEVCFFAHISDQMAEQHFDYIIAGAGCAGLSLAYQISLQPALSKKRILLIDKDTKTSNDRTWCFWEKKPGPFEEIVHKKWKNAWFHGPSFSKLLHLKPFVYKMIRGDRFYEFVKSHLAQFPTIQLVQAEILQISNNGNQAKVETSIGSFGAEWVFSSIRPIHQKKDGHHYLLQHFLGWEIQAEKPVFNPEEPVLMDFRIDQGGDCRFMYILPENEHRALLEFTLFSEELLTKPDYEKHLKVYINGLIPDGNFSILHEEFGVIPMYSEPFNSSNNPRIVQIGTSGGQTKASTGYTFTRIQRHSAELAQALAEGKSPNEIGKLGSNRFEWFDNVLLHVLAKRIVPGATIFQNLFKYNPTSAVFQFLDEESTLLQEFRIMNSVPVFKFIGPGLKELFKLNFR